MSKAQERQRLIRYYREQTRKTEVDMREVVEFAVKHLGYPLPRPADPLDMLAKQFADAARQEIRYDGKTKRPYRANHAVPREEKNGQTVFSWIDIDDPAATADSFRKSAVSRREQMVDDGLQLSLDLDHWNSIRPSECVSPLPWDLTMDIDIRRAALDEEEEKAA